jgi:RimJ/RimL family protein N-acetyltransferase
MVTLRPAALADGPWLLTLRNHPRVVAMSESQRSIEAAAHHAWLTERLGQAAPHLYLAEVNTVPIGMGRLDWIDASWRVSVAVLPRWWHRGYATQILAQLLELAGSVVCTAVVHRTNVASRRLFSSAGFIPLAIRGDWIDLERVPS